MEVALGTAFDAALFVVATTVVGAGGDVPAVAVVSDAAAEQNPGDGGKAAEVDLVDVEEPAVVEVAGVEPSGHGWLVNRSPRLGADFAVAESCEKPLNEELQSVGSEVEDIGGAGRES